MSIDLANLVNPMGFVSDLVEGVVEGLTGSELLGDLAALGVDLSTGNIIKAVEHGLEAGQDLVESTGKQSDRNARTGDASCPPEPTVHYARPAYREADPASGTGYTGRPVASRGRPAGDAGGQPPILAGYAERRDHTIDPVQLGRAFGEVVATVYGLVSDAQRVQSSGPVDIEARTTDALAGEVDELDREIENYLRDIEDGTDNQATLTKLQRALDRRSQMMNLLTNMMSMFHETSMAVIGHVR